MYYGCSFTGAWPAGRSVSLHHVCDPGPPLQPPSGLITFREGEVSRTAGATAQAKDGPLLLPFHPHTGAQRTKQLSSQLPPNLILLAHPPLRSSCFSADV